MPIIGPEDNARNPIIALVEQWIRRHAPFDRVVADLAAVPADLLPTITSHEPWRTRALDDARYFLAQGGGYGQWMEVLVATNLEVEPFDRWEQSIGPLKYRVQWQQNMEGTMPDWFDGSFARIGYEDGSWRVIEVWDDAARASNIEAYTVALPLLRKRSAAAAPPPEPPEPPRTTWFERAIRKFFPDA